MITPPVVKSKFVPSIATVAELFPRVVIPVDDKVVNAPVPAVVTPTFVEFIPVAVVLKFDEVNVNAVAPVFIDDAVKPDKVKAPDVPVRFKAPVVSVNPFEAVNSPAEVIR